MKVGAATAKINLALVVGPERPDGRHEVVTVLQRVALADRISMEPAEQTVVSGFPDDSLVHTALTKLGERAGGSTAWRATIEKRIPVAAGLGGGSSDAGTALVLANESLQKPRLDPELHELARSLGADVPFFLRSGPQLGTADGTELVELDLPQDYAVLLLVPKDVVKESTAAVYRSFDDRGGEIGFPEREAELRDALATVHRARDLARLPPNDLASSPFARRIEELGAFRADVSGAGPAVYGLFDDRAAARAAETALRHVGRTFVTVPAWYR
jgi:4-diphosphocytidyl-2-C-methyl-D-erythritol kinase